MVLSNICEHEIIAFYFASTSSDKICLASNEHFSKYNWRAPIACFGNHCSESIRDFNKSLTTFMSRNVFPYF